MSRYRPIPRQDGYITILEEPNFLISYILKRNENTYELEWFDLDGITPLEINSIPVAANIKWNDIYVSSLSWAVQPRTVNYRPVGTHVERTETIGEIPSLSFQSAMISREVKSLSGFRKKYRILLEYKEEPGLLPYEEFQFTGATQTNFSVSGETVTGQDVSFSVEDLI